jgi:hypothetical protein
LLGGLAAWPKRLSAVIPPAPPLIVLESACAASTTTWPLRAIGERWLHARRPPHGCRCNQQGCRHGGEI